MHEGKPRDVLGVTKAKYDHPFRPHTYHPNVCGQLIPSGMRYPEPMQIPCSGIEEDHPQPIQENEVTLPQHSRFGAYTPPASSEGDEYKPRDHYGNHAIVVVREYKPEVVTSNSPNGAPAVIVDLYDLNKKAVFRDVLMMTGAIVDGFKAHAGKNPIVIQWEKRVAKNGRDYAAPVPAVPAAIEAAEAVYAQGDPFAPTLGTIAQSEAPF